eukprot:maker-scaffold_26-snap-gene-0.1-mRNA-1 protein AED:0.01 eAED:0.01 QI:532/1/1/1/1/1/2/196/334
MNKGTKLDRNDSMEEQHITDSKSSSNERLSKHISTGFMEKLQEKGREELWAIDREEICFSEEKFASGSGGELFKVTWRGLKCVAKTTPKTVSKIALQDLANEIKVLSNLRHPNLVMFLGASFEPKKPPVLLMEYCGGGNLERKLVVLSAQAAKLKKRKALQYSLDLSLAINFLHKCKPLIVHRDLKPSNILLTEGGKLKVTDFGLSKFIPKAKQPQTDKYTMTGETGSYRFMAPEVFRHEDYNESVDAYSFSLIVYWMLTGQRPFGDIVDPVEAAKKASEGRKPYVQLVHPTRLRNMLERCWSHVPEERPDFSSIVKDIEAEIEHSNKKGCSVQ